MTNRYEDIERFNKEKEKILTRADMSKKGQVDEEIRNIVELINEKKDFCTTSSCAGRITLLERKTSKKLDARWVFSSHNPVEFKDVKDSLKSNSDVWLMQESCIIHIFCRTIEAAERFLLACRESGFKRSGIISTRNKIMIESMGNEKVEAIVMKDGEVIVNDKHLNILVDESNSRMIKNREKMEKLYEQLKKLK